MLISRFNNENVEIEIVNLEKRYDISIPDQYKRFLIHYNGGDTPETKFRVGKSASDIRGFYGVGNVDLSLSKIELDEWIEHDLIPVACDSFGNYIVINISDKFYGKIFFCNHEAGGKKVCIGKNLKDFVKHCKSKKISDDTRKSIKQREKELIAEGRGYIIDDELRQMWAEELDEFGDMVQEEVIIQ